MPQAQKNVGADGSAGRALTAAALDREPIVVTVRPASGGEATRRLDLSRLPARSAIVAFSAEEVYALAEMLRRHKGGAANLGRQVLEDETTPSQASELLGERCVRDRMPCGGR